MVVKGGVVNTLSKLVAEVKEAATSFYSVITGGNHANGGDGTLITLKLDQTTVVYCVDAQTIPETSNGGHMAAVVKVSGPTRVFGIYEKYEHSLLGGDEFRISSTIHRGNKIPFEPGHPSRPYEEAYVYYCEGDDGHEHPLLLELAPKSGSFDYYKLVEDAKNVSKEDVEGGKTKKWKRVEERITHATFKNSLDLQNCQLNNAHIVNLSPHRPTELSYYCLAHCGTMFTVIRNPIKDRDYLKISHVIEKKTSGGGSVHSQFSVSRFKETLTDQDGLPYVRNVSRVNVFFFPKHDGSDYLIHYKEDKDHWFSRNKKIPSEWDIVSKDIPSGENDSEKIEKFLKSYCCEVTIKGDCLKSDGSCTSYTDPACSKNNIKIRKEVVYAGGKPTDYYSVRYTLNEGDKFQIKDITYGGKPLHSVIPKDILSSLTLFYRGKEPTLENLLLFEFHKYRTNAEYIYYSNPVYAKIPWKVAVRADSRCVDRNLKNALDTIHALYNEKDGNAQDMLVKAAKWLAGGGVTGVASYGGWQALVALSVPI